jgi:hypothetical protein
MKTPSMPSIDSYEFGTVEIDGRKYTSDVIILPYHVQDNWRRETGHSLSIGDLQTVFDAAPDVLVIGQGAHGCMSVPDETMERLKDAGIDLVCASTPEAVRLYNERSGGEQTVAAALHLTC